MSSPSPASTPLNTPTDAQVASFLNRATQLLDDIAFSTAVEHALSNGVSLKYSDQGSYFSPASTTPSKGVAQVPAIRLAADLNDQLLRRGLSAVIRSRREMLSEVQGTLDTWVDMFHGVHKRGSRPDLEQPTDEGDLRLIELLVHSLTFRAPKG
jgi:hypothetical protein